MNKADRLNYDMLRMVIVQMAEWKGAGGRKEERGSNKGQVDIGGTWSSPIV